MSAFCGSAHHDSGKRKGAGVLRPPPAPHLQKPTQQHARQEHLQSRGRTPLAAEFRALWQASDSVRGILAPILGREMTDKWLDACLRAENFAPIGGGKHCPRSARVRFAATPQRLADCPEVRAASAWLVSILDHLKPGQSKVAAGAKLWLGCGRKRQDGKALRCPPRSLASKLDRSTRQLQRYAAIARSCGIVDNLQPPPGSVTDRRLVSKRTGHAYAMYQLAVVPRELAVRLARWYRTDRGFTGTAVAAEPPERRPLSAAAQEVAKLWASQAPPLIDAPQA